MGTLNLVLRAELRRRWRSWLALAALIAVAGGFVMAAAAAGRRTASAFPRYAGQYGADVVVYSSRPMPELDRLRAVSSVTEVVGAYSGQPSCACVHPINPNDFSAGVVMPGGWRLAKLLSGHLPDPTAPYQALASFTLEQDYGLRLGSVVRVPFYSPTQAREAEFGTGSPPVPKGPVATFRIVGFEAAEPEFPTGSGPSYDLFLTPAFARSVLPRTAAGYIYFVRLHGAADGMPHFMAEAQATHLVSAGFGSQNMDAAATAVESSVHPQAIGWWILAVLGGIVAVVVVGQALFRQSAFESQEYPALAAIGADRRQLFALGMLRTFVVAVVGACGALLIAAALSPLAPLGEARMAEVSTGVSYDGLVLSLGALATIFVVLALGIWPSLRAARRARAAERTEGSRPSEVVAGLARMGAPPSMLVGVRHALERRSGDAAVPVGSALVGSVLAVIALCATAVFGASLTHLTATPRLYGVDFQLNISDLENTQQPDPFVLQALERDKTVTGITRGFALEVSIDKIPAGAVAGSPLRGPLPFSAVSGHLPYGRQVGLGIATMRELGAHLGSVLDVSVTLPTGEQRTAPFRVVSQISFPVIAGTVGLGSGVLLTIPGLEDAMCPHGPARTVCGEQLEDQSGIGGGLLATFIPGPRGTSDANSYVDAYRSLVTLPTTPTSLINFGEAVNFPLIFGAILAAFGAATLLHLLVVSVSRRRRDIALLKVLGFVNFQVGSAVAWQATTLAIVGTVIGAPIGVLIGRTVWDTFANNLGAVPVSVVPFWLLCALLAGVIVFANLIAVPPALVATRSRPEELLRAQ